MNSIEEKMDIHIHTSHGDKRFLSPEEILERAKESGISIIAFTDYERLDAYFELREKYTTEEIKAKYGVEIIVGTEVNAKIGDKYRDVLVYNITDIDGFQEWLKANTGLDKTPEAQSTQLEHYKRKAKEIGLIFDENIAITSTEPWAGRTMASALNAHEVNYNIIPKEILSDRTLFFMRYCTNPESPLFFDMGQYKPTLEKLSEAVTRFGGVISQAHPGAYVEEDTQKSMDALLEEGLKRGATMIEGYNCFNQIGNRYGEFASNFAKRNNLYITGGTDFHEIGDIGYLRGNPNMTPRYLNIGVINNGELGNFIPANGVRQWAKFWNVE